MKAAKAKNCWENRPPFKVKKVIIEIEYDKSCRKYFAYVTFDEEKNQTISSDNLRVLSHFIYMSMLKNYNEKYE